MNVCFQFARAPRIVSLLGLTPLALVVSNVAKSASAQQNSKTITITVDATAKRHPIDPRIYGVAFATMEQLRALNVPLNRMGGNSTTRYNWQQNADNRANDWFFESIADQSAIPGERGDSFVNQSRAGGAEPMITVPTVDWVAKLGPNREKAASFSVAKYGAQQKTDQWMPDAGNGLKPDGKEITGNDPNDANVPNTSTFQQQWVKHLVKKWGTASKGGVKYYVLDNEPAIWHSTHRDVQPTGITMQGLRDKIIDYATKIKAVDPDAKIIAPEEWGWTGYFYSGYDAQQGSKVGWDPKKMPDRAKNGGMEMMPWLLDQLHKHEVQTGRRLLDVFTLHFYPQGGEYGEDVSAAMQLRRNRSTRALWDTNYQDETWIKDKVRLIPRMQEWTQRYAPNTPIGITEYNWGAEKHINGATTQADILGIFGREGLDMAARWTTPPTDSPTFKAIQMYRNYDGKKSAFGNQSVSAVAPDPDQVAAFAARRLSDGTLTLMLVNKQLETSAAINLDLRHFKPSQPAQLWQLTAKNAIDLLPTLPTKRPLKLTVPPQSITMLVIPGR